VSISRRQEVTRLSTPTAALSTDWLFAAYDGATLHLVSDVPQHGEPVENRH
jgi:hypothetical protein